MHSLPVYHRFRVFLKYLHIISSSIWLGTGSCVLLLLYLQTQTAKGDELYAFTLTILCIDSYLLIPAACICVLSGIIICFVEDLDMFSCRWIIGKSIWSITAMFIGAFFMIPWMAMLSRIVNIERIMALTNMDYRDVWRADVYLGVVQTGILLYII